jgi:two-component system, LytTR family, sensor kinase
MKDLIFKPDNFKKIEFWAATAIFVFLVFFHITHALNIDWPPRQGSSTPQRYPFGYHFVYNLIQYVILYGTFLILNFFIVPKLIRRESLVLNIISILVIYLVIGTLFGTMATYLKYAMQPGARVDRVAHNFQIQNSFLYAFWLLLVFGLYTAIKYTGIYLLTRSESIQSRYKMLTPGSLLAIVLWMISMFFFIAISAPWEFITGWGIIIPSGILFYSYAYHIMIRSSLRKKKPFRNFLGKCFVILLLSIVPMGFLILIITHTEDVAAGISTFNAALHFFVTTPLVWAIFKRNLAGSEELADLKKELGRSTANFDFLRSQINPHFLFNALNTIYGTALQEKAERTSEGIEKLGDMMRFMLQENMQDKISLKREIDYLNNYIGLQKLRTDPNPIVRIDSYIEHPTAPVQIAPMLLIPFVENAFKHGISFREHSHIKISLEVKEKTIYFDVSNSKHLKPELDPEKDKNGIGLNNVKQRLQLLYPGKHELVIRETAKDFFVHLTIRLA